MHRRCQPSMARGIENLIRAMKEIGFRSKPSIEGADPVGVVHVDQPRERCDSALRGAAVVKSSERSKEREQPDVVLPRDRKQFLAEMVEVGFYARARHQQR